MLQLPGEGNEENKFRKDSGGNTPDCAVCTQKLVHADVHDFIQM